MDYFPTAAEARQRTLYNYDKGACLKPVCDAIEKRIEKGFFDCTYIFEDSDYDYKKDIVTKLTELGYNVDSHLVTGYIVISWRQ